MADARSAGLPLPGRNGTRRPGVLVDIGGPALIANTVPWAVLEPLVPGVQASPLPTAVVSITGRYLFANPPYCSLLGRDLEQLRDLSVADVTHPEDAARDGRALWAVARGHLSEHQIRKRYLRPDGTVVDALVHVGAVRDADGRPVALIANVLDVTGQPEDSGGSLCEERSFRLLFAANPQPMWIYDLETLRFLEVNDAACAHYGYTRKQFRSRTIADIRPADHVQALRTHATASRPALQHSGVWRHLRADGREIEVEVVSHELVFDGRDAVLVSAQDVTERNLFERQLMHQALHHPLSGLPNLALFLDRLGQAIAAGEDGVVGVLYVDLDDFQLVNESLGHEGGDAVLAALGARLAASFPAGITVGSITREKLAICAGGLPDASGATALARRVQAVIAEPIVADGGTEISLSACVGVTTAAGPDADPALLVRDASLAAAQAKQVGAGQVAILDKEARPATFGRLGARHALRQAIETGQIKVHYQPVVSLATGEIVGAEALARWAHPERGLVSPTEFIPLAEETGLIVALGRTVLETACRDAARWPNAATSGAALGVSVNVSGRQLRDGHLVELARQVLVDTGLDPARLALEMTETVLIDHGEAVSIELAALRDLGVHLSLDDFGTGYSSLTHLDRLPFDIVKIDRSFVTGMHGDPRHQAIVSGVISLAEALGLTVVAEGVETDVEAADLAGLGAKFAQGYHFFAPMPAGQLAELLSESGCS
ncbi:MAG: putative bifunctional diguanylate cyclase/phosphodiesterase [Acidimicrobiales bacterium]